MRRTAYQLQLERIRHSGYLQTGLRKFRGACDSNGSLFIFGHSLAENDAHILNQMIKGTIKNYFISIFGPGEDPRNQDIMQRARLIASARDDLYPLDVHFFDASSAHVWDNP